MECAGGAGRLGQDGGQVCAADGLGRVMEMTRFAVGSVERMHRTGSARSAPPPDRPPAPVPPPPPRWRKWLLIVGMVLSLALFFLPIPITGSVEQLSYSQLKQDISAGQVATVAIGPDGNISGTLTTAARS